MPPFLLIAEREFRAYVATLSFWVALAVGPLAIAGAVALMHFAEPPAGAPPTIAIETSSHAIWRSAAAALGEAAQLEDRQLTVLPPGSVVATTRIQIPLRSDGKIDLAIDGPLPLSPAGKALVLRTLERDAALARLGSPPVEFSEPLSAEVPPPRGAHSTAGPAMARFSMVMMLWLTLTGSLGMLLQAVVRERANRALETLLAAARPADIVAGKLSGVGAVSLLVLVTWLAAGAALAPFAPNAAGLGDALMASVANPLEVTRAALIYVLAFAFYGLVTVALGAGARDVAQAQNLSRPMFAVLLAAFFAALIAAGGGAHALSWLVFVPPFTPFMLLLIPPSQLGGAAETTALCLLAVAALAAGRVAVARLNLSPATAPKTA
jgi:ABC-2 type transport system permease protein